MIKYKKVLPSILNRDFLVFEMRNQPPINLFIEKYPEFEALKLLPLRHNLENENPQTFQGLCEFGCKRK